MILAVETRTPNLNAIRTLLLYLQFQSRYVREPAWQGQWGLSSVLVGMAQDIGLNIDTADWNIPIAERKPRRILWCAVKIELSLDQIFQDWSDEGHPPQMH